MEEEEGACLTVCREQRTQKEGIVEWEVTFRAMHPVTSSGKTLPPSISRTVQTSDSVWGHLIFKIS